MSVQYNDDFFSSDDFQAFFKSSIRSTIIKANAPQFTIVAVSDSYLALTRRKPEDLVGQNFFSIFPGNAVIAAQQEVLLQSFLKVISTKEVDEIPVYQYQIFMPETGEYVTQYWSNKNEPVQDKESNVSYIIRTVTNITDKVVSGQIAERNTELQDSLRREQELNEELAATNEELRSVNEELHNSQERMTSLTSELEERVTSRTKQLAESEERFRTMAENSDILIATSDEHMNTSYLNNSWYELTGVAIENLLRSGWIDLLHPDDKEPFSTHYLTAFSQRIYFTGEFRIKDKNGDYKWLYVQCPPHFRSDGSFAGYIASAIDITERKKDEQRKNDFIAMVSHEMKTPVTSLSGYLQLLNLRAKTGDDFTRNMIDKAARQVTRITTLINGFLNVSRLESGKIQIDKTRFDMAELVREAEEEVQSTINSHQVIFAPVKTTWVHADKDKISQVISNLISNAVKYSPADTVINVSCETIDGCATITVKDEGIGIKEEDQPKLFDRYYRVNEDGHTASGFGIGLYLCAEIIQRHDGKIWVKSEVGKGSVFSFNLPVVS